MGRHPHCACFGVPEGGMVGRLPTLWRASEDVEDVKQDNDHQRHAKQPRDNALHLNLLRLFQWDNTARGGLVPLVGPGWAAAGRGVWVGWAICPLLARVIREDGGQIAHPTAR